VDDTGKVAVLVESSDRCVNLSASLLNMNSNSGSSNGNSNNSSNGKTSSNGNSNSNSRRNTNEEYSRERVEGVELADVEVPHQGGPVPPTVEHHGVTLVRKSQLAIRFEDVEAEPEMKAPATTLEEGNQGGEKGWALG